MAKPANKGKVNKGTNFEEFRYCKDIELKTNLDNHPINKMGISKFKFFLEVFKENKQIGNSEINKEKNLSKTEKDEIKKQAKSNFLKNYEYTYRDDEGEKVTTNFVNELVKSIYDAKVNKHSCKNISNIINNLSKVGLTSKDLYNNAFAKAVKNLINKIFKEGHGSDFIPQEIALTLNGLSQLKYKKEI